MIEEQSSVQSETSDALEQTLIEFEESEKPLEVEKSSEDPIPLVIWHKNPQKPLEELSLSSEHKQILAKARALMWEGHL